MKVLHILNEILPSGAEMMLHSSAAYWDETLERHVLATGDAEGVFADHLREVGYVVHHIHEASYSKQHKAVRALIKQEQFDIVHIHRQGEAYSYARDAKKSGAKRIVRTVHNVFVFHGPVQVREWITRQLAERLGVRHISIGKSVHENEWNRFRVKCTMIPNWYDENKFTYATAEMKTEARRKLGIDEDAYCVVSVGNCSPVKNHMSILRALADLKELCADKNVLYLHVGHGAQEGEEKRFAEDVGIEKYVRFIGFADPVDYLRAADLFVMPSTHEGFSISATEGLATGIRAIFTEVPGLRDFCDLQLDNLVYCKLNDEAISDSLRSSIESGRKPNSLAQAEAIKTALGIARGVAQYQRVYFDGLTT